MTSCIAGLLALSLSVAPTADPPPLETDEGTPPTSEAEGGPRTVEPQAVEPQAVERTVSEKATAPSPSALALAVQARTPEEQAGQSGFQLMLGLDHSLGLGTFVDPQRYALLLAHLVVAPTYLFGLLGQRFAASAVLRAGFEYTLPDVETGRRVTVTDLRLGLSAPAILRDRALTGIAFTPSLSLTVPTSPESWNAGLVTNLGATISASRSFGPVDVRLSLGGTRGFFASPQTGMRATNSRDSDGNRLVLCRQDEPVCGFSGWNTEWSFSVGGQVGWRATGNLLVYLGYSFMKSWRHPATLSVDEYTPKAVDSSGQPVACVGLCQSDHTRAFLGASYQIDPHYSVDLGLFTMQTPLSDDGRSVRFPWLSVGAWAANRTTISLSLTAAY